MKKPWAYIVIQIFAQKPTSEDKKKEYKKVKNSIVFCKPCKFFFTENRENERKNDSAPLL